MENSTVQKFFASLGEKVQSRTPSPFLSREAAISLRHTPHNLLFSFWSHVFPSLSCPGVQLPKEQGQEEDWKMPKPWGGSLRIVLRSHREAGQGGTKPDLWLPGQMSQPHRY